MAWPYHPQIGGKLRVDGPSTRLRERADWKGSYRYQLEAFRDAIMGDEPNLASIDQAIATMKVVDDIYRAAGMRPRQPLDSIR